MYTVLVSPMLTCSSIVGYTPAIRSIATGQLYMVQRQACIEVIVVIWTCPSKVVNAMAHIIPIDLFLMKVLLALRSDSLQQVV